MRCSGCGLVNFQTEQSCRRCGRAITATASSASVINPTMTRPVQTESSGRYIRRMIFGLLWVTGGTAVSVGTYLSAASNPGGGRYFVAWGAILFGAVDFLIGLSGWMKQRSESLR